MFLVQGMCGGMVIDQRNGTIRTPDFLNGYVGILNCVWVIATNDLSFDIGRITFTNRSVSTVNKECLDSMKIYDGWNNLLDR